jgi:four helix bundle protein
MLTLESLKAYQLSRQLSQIGWKVYDTFTWQLKKIIGDQFIEATDSTGANIAEGYGRFHYLDRIKFLYNARGSLLESKHWFELFIERKLLDDKAKIEKEYFSCYNELLPCLNGLINSLYRNKLIIPNNQ